MSKCEASAPAEQPSIGIIGAGIGGLALSNNLVRHGFRRVQVFDQAENFVPTAGAGFGLSPNGHMCLLSMGIDASIGGNGGDNSSSDGGGIVHPFNRISRMDRAGTVQRTTSNIFGSVRDKYGYGFGGCLRADLVHILEQPLVREEGKNMLHYSHRLTSIVDDGGKVRVTFDNGVEQQFDLVIGADGINSTVAELLDIDPSPPIYSGANIFYGVIPDPDSIPFQHSALTSKEANHTVLQGPGTGEFISFRVGPEQRKCHVWANTYVSDEPPPKDVEEWDVARREAKDQVLGQILGKFPSTHPIHELAAHTPPGRLLHFGLHYRKHKRTWSKGRVCLLGDSCHATLPYVGQGANQSIEDAIVLADCIQSSYPDYRTIFDTYYTKRSRRTQRIVSLGNFLDGLYHSSNPFTHMCLDWVLNSILKGGVMFKQIEKEIVEECPVDYKTLVAK